MSNIIDFKSAIKIKDSRSKHSEYILKVNEGLQLKKKWIKTVAECLPIITLNDETYDRLKSAVNDISDLKTVDYLTKNFLQSFVGVFWIDRHLDTLKQEYETQTKA